jgi:hypothetical protein
MEELGPRDPDALPRSRKFLARAAHYRSLGLAEADGPRAEILLEISALFIKMAADVAVREIANSGTLKNAELLKQPGDTGLDGVRR